MIAGWIQALCAVLDTPAVPWHQVASALTTLEYVVHMYVLKRQAPLYERTQLPPALAPFVNARDFAARQRASRAIVRWEMVTHTARYVLTMLRIVFLANALAWTWAGRLVQHSEKGQMVAYVCVLPALFFPFEQLVNAGELYMAQRQLSPASLAPWRTHLRDFFIMLPFRVLLSLAVVFVATLLIPNIPLRETNEDTPVEDAGQQVLDASASESGESDHRTTGEGGAAGLRSARTTPPFTTDRPARTCR